MAKLNIKKGDNVVVIAGKDKGKTGKVLEVSLTESKVTVEGVNIITKHQKAKNAKEKGGIVKKPAPVEISNLMVVCPSCGKATRVAKKNIDGVNTRICKKCGAGLDKAFVKAVKKDSKKSSSKTETAIKDKDIDVKATSSKSEKEVKAKTKSTSATKTTGVKKATVAKTKEASVKPTASKAKTQTTARKSAGRGN